MLHPRTQMQLRKIFHQYMDHDETISRHHLPVLQPFFQRIIKDVQLNKPLSTAIFLNLNILCQIMDCGGFAHVSIYLSGRPTHSYFRVKQFEEAPHNYRLRLGQADYLSYCLMPCFFGFFICISILFSVWVVFAHCLCRFSE